MIFPMMTVDDLVEALGGTGATAVLLGLSAPAVSNWRAAGAVPPKHHYRLYRLCQERGIDWQPPASEAA